MNNTAEELASLFYSTALGDKQQLQDAIQFFDDLDPRYSSRMLELTKEMGEDRIYVRGTFRRSLMEGTVEDSIEKTLQQYCLCMLDQYTGPKASEWDTTTALMLCKSGNQIIKEDHPELRPDLYTASMAALKSYFRKISVAARVQHASGTDSGYRRQLPVFMEWAGDQPEKLELALKFNSIVPEDLEELSAIAQQTATVFHDGVL